MVYILAFTFSSKGHYLKVLVGDKKSRVNVLFEDKKGGKVFGRVHKIRGEHVKKKFTR